MRPWLLLAGVATAASFGLAACQNGAATTTKPATGTSEVVAATTLAATTSTLTTTTATQPAGEGTEPPTAVVVEADDAFVTTVATSEVLAEYVIDWVPTADVRTFNPALGGVGVLEETGEGPSCWTASPTSLFIVDQIQNRIIVEVYGEENRRVFELDFDGSVAACRLEGDNAVLLVADIANGSQHTQVRVVDLGSGRSNVAAAVPDSVAGRLFRSSDGTLWFSFIPLTDSVEEEFQFAAVANEVAPKLRWEVYPAVPIELRGGSVAEVLVEGAHGSQLWRLGSSAAHDLVVLDSFAVDDDLLVHGLSPGMVHLWRLDADSVHVEFGIDISDAGSFGRTRSSVVVDDAGRARLIVAEAAADGLRFVEYTNP